LLAGIRSAIAEAIDNVMRSARTWSRCLMTKSANEGSASLAAPREGLIVSSNGDLPCLTFSLACASAL